MHTRMGKGEISLRFLSLAVSLPHCCQRSAVVNMNDGTCQSRCHQWSQIISIISMTMTEASS